MKDKLTKEQASGMTLNERLFVAGLMHDFDKARNEGDKVKLRIILEKVFLPSDDIDFVIGGLFK